MPATRHASPSARACWVPTMLQRPRPRANVVSALCPFNNGSFAIATRLRTTLDAHRRSCGSSCLAAVTVRLFGPACSLTPSRLCGGRSRS